jgi:hypothetical protein
LDLAEISKYWRFSIRL